MSGRSRRRSLARVARVRRGPRGSATGHRGHGGRAVPATPSRRPRAKPGASAPLAEARILEAARDPAAGQPPTAAPRPRQVPTIVASRPRAPPRLSGVRAPDAPAAPRRAASAGSTPLLDQVGRDLTALAREGLLAPADRPRRRDRPPGRGALPADPSERGAARARGHRQGRDRRGPGGEDRAGSVPAPLRGARIVELPVAALVAGHAVPRPARGARRASSSARRRSPDVVLFVEGRRPAGAGRPHRWRLRRARGDARAARPRRAAGRRDGGAPTRSATAAEARARRPAHPDRGRAELDREATRPCSPHVRDRLATTQRRDGSTTTPSTFCSRSPTSTDPQPPASPTRRVDLLSEAIAAAIVAGRTTVEADDAAGGDRGLVAAGVRDPDARQARSRPRRARPRGPARARSSGATARSTPLIGVLLRRTKRNPALVGPAGSGKTAIVEGLAIRIASGRVPGASATLRLLRRPPARARGGRRDARRASWRTCSPRRATRRSSCSSTRCTCSPCPPSTTSRSGSSRRSPAATSRSSARRRRRSTSS